MILEDSLPTSRHPLRPRGLLTMNAKQLSSYGGSLETAVTDLEHYRSSGSAVLVLCGGETRAKNLHRLLEEKGIPYQSRVLELDMGQPFRSLEDAAVFSAHTAGTIRRS